MPHPLLRAEGGIGAPHVGPPARLHTVPIDSEIGPQLTQRDLAADDSDGAGQGAGLGDDAVGRRRAEIAAGGRQVAPGADQRLAWVAGALHLAPEGGGAALGTGGPGVAE